MITTKQRKATWDVHGTEQLKRHLGLWERQQGLLKIDICRAYHTAVREVMYTVIRVCCDDDNNVVNSWGLYYSSLLITVFSFFEIFCTGSRACYAQFGWQDGIE